MTIKQEYQRARRNYMARVNRLVKQGYMVDVIQIPKKPTQKSIDRLKKQTGKEIARKSTLVDMETGEKISKNSKKKKKIAKSNRELIKKPLQEIDRVINKPKQSILNLIPTVKAEPSQVDMIIEKWYDTVETFRPAPRELVKQRTDELVTTQKDRELFAYTFIKSGSLFPDITDYDEKVINAKFSEIRKTMQWADDTPEFQEFVDAYGVIESEGE